MPDECEDNANQQAAALNAAAATSGGGLTGVGAGRRSSTPYYGNGGNTFGGTNRCIIAFIVYLALFLDNVLLTVIVPILPDYLASINNQTLYTRTVPSRGGRNAGFSGNEVVGPQVVYRNYHSTDISGSHPLLQTIQTKHPIPGKSMVNFSMLHPVVDDKVPSANMLTHESQQQQQQHEHQQYLTMNKNSNSSRSNSTDSIKIVASSNLGNVNSSGQQISAATTPSAQQSMAHGAQSDQKETVTAVMTTTDLESENGSIGLLLAMKALVQLIFNPIVGNMSSKFGYRLPIVAGTFCLLMSSLVFAVGETYITLLLARAIQGVGSACIGVCGMSLVAQHYPEEERRSKVMGIILGSIALGVLVGYPFGGFLYDLVGKSAPFVILSTIIFLSLGMQLIVMDLSVQPEVVMDNDRAQPKWQPLLESKMILAIIIAIWFSTSTMAILEPCLPIWLMEYLRPTKWQLGTVFIPDSVGYFVGTNFFGSIAYKYGQVKISCISLLLVGISSVLIPSATSVAQLLLPHFCLGLGIGIIDAALVPLLATFVDATLMQEEQDNTAVGSSSISSYGTVYCLQQTSVSLAYCLAPLIGGELAEAIGFAWLMRIVGAFNIIYGPILVYLYHKYDPKTLREKHNEMLLISSDRGGSQYKQLYNSMDME